MPLFSDFVSMTRQDTPQPDLAPALPSLVTGSTSVEGQSSAGIGQLETAHATEAILSDVTGTVPSVDDVMSSNESAMLKRVCAEYHLNLIFL